MFYFHPYLGKISILTNIFQTGWNQQLDDNGTISPIWVDVFPIETWGFFQCREGAMS